ncbi:MAG: bifunctional ornithine acetyltransferase/N-acetylglutamate synthase, partial [Oscillospiraceae bacterium]|nr:bifunctional ornithine acetyltransferase/N-acetylglutamate synthase [Oscillospiraceae bacterium]
MFLQYVPGGVAAPIGFTAAGVHCGIRKNRNKKDLALILSEVPASAAALHTQNLVLGAPNVVTGAHLENGIARAIFCNSGIANTCAADGIETANRMCELAAEALGIAADDVIVASTGVIGPSIPIEPVAAAMPVLAAALSAEGGADAAEAIMTTDTVKKEAALRFPIGGRMCHVGGIAKGSGMIAPDMAPLKMATMLAFITTDVSIAPQLLREALMVAAADSFNMLSIDGDTSTNDMLAILANGMAKNQYITGKNEDYWTFLERLKVLCETLTKK